MNYIYDINNLPVQGVPRLSPDDRWDRLEPPRNPVDGLSGYRKWMDGWISIISLKARRVFKDMLPSA